VDRARLHRQILTAAVGLLLTATLPLPAGAAAAQAGKAEPPADAGSAAGDGSLPAGAIRCLASRWTARSDSAYSLAFTPDGKTLICGGRDRTLRSWDLRTGRELRRFPELVDREIHGLAVTADGKTLALACADAIPLFDTATGKEIRRLYGHNHLVLAVAFAPDAKTLASAGWDETVRVWDVAHGKELRKLKAHRYMVGSVAFAADGEMLVSFGASDDRLRLWDAARGKPLCRFASDNYRAAAFAPDGKFLAAATRSEVIVWELASANVFVRLSAGGRGHAGIHFSADGRTFWANESDAAVCLWELDSGLVRLRLHESKPLAGPFAVSPDGRLLASARADGSVLLWDATGQAAAKEHTGLPSPPQWEVLWNGLAQTSGPHAQRAIWTFASAPDQAVPILRKRLAAAPGISVSQLIDDLDSPRFIVRDKATRELEKRGKSIDKLLRQALVGAKSLEMRRRLERLLNGAAQQHLSPEQLQKRRAIEALEAMATPAAQKLLEDLAKTTAGTVVQIEAEASLKRLRRSARTK
jgi:hypothetical protein